MRESLRQAEEVRLQVAGTAFPSGGVSVNSALKIEALDSGSSARQRIEERFQAIGAGVSHLEERPDLKRVQALEARILHLEAISGRLPLDQRPQIAKGEVPLSHHVAGNDRAGNVLPTQGMQGAVPIPFALEKTGGGRSAMSTLANVRKVGCEWRRKSKPAWSACQSHEFCNLGQEALFQDKATLLDTSKFNSVQDAVEHLNSPKGLAEALQLQPLGFCIVYSSKYSARKYFLLYQRSWHRQAFEYLDIELQWSCKYAIRCNSGEEILFKRRMTKDDTSLRCQTLQEAVDLLNYPHDAKTEKDTVIPRGVCMLLVDTSRESYILHRKNREDATCKQFAKKLSLFAQISQTSCFMWKWMFGCKQDTLQHFDAKEFVHTCSRALDSKYDIKRQLGVGAQGTAYLVQKKSKCAVNDDSLFVAKMSNDERRCDEIQKEYEKMRVLRHPNCVRVVELIHYQPRSEVYIIAEYAKGGDLYKYMHDMMTHEEVPSEDVVAKMMQQAMTGVAYLHAEGVVHNDLKPDNLLVMSEYEKGAAPRVVVADYGCATLRQDKGKVFFGDPRYMSPEGMKAMLKYLDKHEEPKQASPHVDVWAMGATIYEFLGGGVLPFLYEACALKDLKQKASKLSNALLDKQEVKFDISHAPLTDEELHRTVRREGKEHICVESIFSPDAQDLLKRMLKKDATSRYTSLEVLSHAWFKAASKRELTMSQQATIRFHATHNSICQILRNAVASKLRYEHVDKCFHTFSLFDPDRSGTICKDEFAQAWAQLCPKCDEDAGEAFARADVDENGSLEFNEFVAATLDWHTVQDDILDQELLDMFDGLEEGAKYIDVATFCKEMERWTGQHSSEFKASISDIDKDNDGIITLAELKGFIRDGGENMLSRNPSIHFENVKVIRAHC